jgi:2-polyprenyl-6-methoxyphenol hydroxylase-like FAD-dependent oxidoreductase
MAGLLAARVLSERFAQVWILERDELPNDPATRKGTPQVGHAHALLAKGRHVIEDLFPGFTRALSERGAELRDGGSDVPVLVGGRPLALAPTGDVGAVCSRLLIEDEVRRRVRALTNVQVMTRVDVVEPIFDATLHRVTGVRIRVGSRAHESTFMNELDDGILSADLVMDCTGRGSRTPQWLGNWGFHAPEEERVTIGVGYVTAYFERKPDQLPNVAAVISTATRDMLAPAVMIAQEPASPGECKRWVITLAGFAGDHPEATLEGVKRRALRCGSDAIARVAHESTLVSPVTRYGFPHSQRRRYERLRRFPERFLVMGDALASFNPIYGQGMTVAACEALALRSVLARGLEGIRQPFFRAAAKAIDNPWQIAVGADLAIPTVQGERTLVKRLVNAYMRALFRAAERDAVVTTAFRSVTHMMKSPAALFAPKILARVAWSGFIRFIDADDFAREARSPLIKLP